MSCRGRTKSSSWGPMITVKRHADADPQLGTLYYIKSEVAGTIMAAPWPDVFGC